MKWLGKKFVEHVKKIRAVHLNNMEIALRMIWDRFKECYSSSKMVESALFK